MFRNKKKKKKHFYHDQELIDHIYQLKRDWMSLQKIMDHSVETTETGQRDLAIAKAKYFYLLKEARARNIKVQY
ncbi:YaaL family protein [Pontibacillus salicampi]|uniref:YaaL family protein n=1 Tax=Pontibacillus salicampi TaxID=1449801 RepID=A0ABV6LUE8_9BACI